MEDGENEKKKKVTNLIAFDMKGDNFASLIYFETTDMANTNKICFKLSTWNVVRFLVLLLFSYPRENLSLSIKIKMARA